MEQKNWLNVRRHVGYDRYSSKAAYAAFQHLYALIRLHVNFFRPVRKLVDKEPASGGPSSSSVTTSR